MPKTNGFDKAIEILTKAKAETEKILSAIEHANVGLMVTAQLENLLHKLHFFAGSTPAGSATTDFPPITNFMGEELNPASDTPADTEPAKTDLDILKEKVAVLYGSIASINPDTILTSYTTPEDQLVLRGVAKQANVKDFKTRPLDIPFVNDILAGITLNAEQAAAKAEYDQKLKDEANPTTKPGSETSPSAGEGDVPDAGISKTTVDPGVSTTGTDATVIADAPNSKKPK